MFSAPFFSIFMAGPEDSAVFIDRTVFQAAKVCGAHKVQWNQNRREG